MPNIWMVADHGISSETGYSRRVFFELEIISRYVEKPLLIYPQGNTVPADIAELCTPVPVRMRKPIILRQFEIQHGLEAVAAQFGEPTVLYAQNLMAAYAVARFAQRHRTSLFMDYHGVVPAEMLQVYGKVAGLVKGTMSFAIERSMIRKANVLIVVSNNLRNYVAKRASCGAAKTTVLPMLPAKVFLHSDMQVPTVKTRGDLGIRDDALLFCYVGQAQVWQMPLETVQFYARLERLLPNAHLLILTNDTSRFLRHAHEAKIKNVTITTAPHAEVPQYLRLCDYGFVLRDSTIVNRVASPTKLLEYVACGVVPIMTPGVGDYYEHLVLKNLGLGVSLAQVYGRDQAIPDFPKPSDEQRRRLRQFVIGHVNDHIDGYLKRLREHCYVSPAWNKEQEP